MILLIMCCVEFVSSCEWVSKLQCRREACWLTRVWFSRQRRNCSAAGCAELMDAEPRLSLFWCPESEIHWCPWRLWFGHSWKKNHDILVWFYSILHFNPIARTNFGLVFVSANRRYVETSHFFMFHFQSHVLTICACDLVKWRDKRHFRSGFGKEV